MSKQEALDTIGITHNEYTLLMRIREPLEKGHSCEVKATNDGCFKVYEIDRWKR